jgi:hypothetical protein
LSVVEVQPAAILDEIAESGELLGRQGLDRRAAGGDFRSARQWRHFVISSFHQ